MFIDYDLEFLEHKDRETLLDYSTQFQNKSKETGLSEEKNSFYQKLSVITYMWLNPSSKDFPLDSVWKEKDGRSPCPADLSQDDLFLLQKLLPIIKPLRLKAHFADILWLRNNEHKMAVYASEHYLQFFLNKDKELGISESWMHATNELQRGLQIAKQIKNNLLINSYKECLLKRFKRIKEKTIQSDAKYCYDLLYISHKFRIIDTSTLSSLAESFAHFLQNTPEQDYCELYFDFAIQTCNARKDCEKFRKLHCEAGIWLMSQAGSARYYSTLTNAVHHLRKGHAPKEQIQKAHDLLLKKQQKLSDIFESFETSTDISSLIKGTRQILSQKKLQSALTNFAAYHLMSYDNENNCILKCIEEHPISFIMPASVHDNHGRIIHKIPAIDRSSTPYNQNVIEDHIFLRIARIVWSIRCHGFILPGIEILTKEHKITRTNLFRFINKNPIIPPGHEEIILEGILAGFHHKMMISMHFLIPQFEAVIRYVLNTIKIITSKLNDNDIQEERLLAPLLAMPDTEKIFGKDLVFELRGLLCEKSGYNFRNELVHGFLNASELKSIPSYNIWWIFFRLLISGYYNK